MDGASLSLPPPPRLEGYDAVDAEQFPLRLGHALEVRLAQRVLAEIIDVGPPAEVGPAAWRLSDRAIRSVLEITFRSQTELASGVGGVGSDTAVHGLTPLAPRKHRLKLARKLRRPGGREVLAKHLVLPCRTFGCTTVRSRTAWSKTVL